MWRACSASGLAASRRPASFLYPSSSPYLNRRIDQRGAIPGVSAHLGARLFFQDVAAIDGEGRSGGEDLMSVSGPGMPGRKKGRVFPVAPPRAEPLEPACRYL